MDVVGGANHQHVLVPPIIDRPQAAIDVPGLRGDGGLDQIDQVLPLVGIRTVGAAGPSRPCAAPGALLRQDRRRTAGRCHGGGLLPGQGRLAPATRAIVCESRTSRPRTFARSSRRSTGCRRVSACNSLYSTRNSRAAAAEVFSSAWAQRTNALWTASANARPTVPPAVRFSPQADFAKSSPPTPRSRRCRVPPTPALLSRPLTWLGPPSSVPQFQDRLPSPLEPNTSREKMQCTPAVPPCQDPPLPPHARRLRPAGTEGGITSCGSSFPPSLPPSALRPPP